MFDEAKLVIIILSEKYFQKNKSLIKEEVNSNKDAYNNIILPVLHKVSKKEMIVLKKVLDNNICRNTFSYDLEDVTTEISEQFLHLF